MSETKKLIEAVKKRPLLYDNTDDDYKNRKKKVEAWQMIAEEMGSKNGEHWNTKWKSLRDNYHKFKKHKETETGAHYKKYRNWPWSELMGFLDGFLFTRPELPALVKKRLRSSEDPPEVYPTASTSEGIETNDAIKLKRQRLSHFDEVDLFFLSYAQNFKRLSAKCQALMKLEIASLFTKYELDEEAESGTALQSAGVIAFENMATVYSDSNASDGSDES